MLWQLVRDTRSKAGEPSFSDGWRHPGDRNERTVREDERRSCGVHRRCIFTTLPRRGRKNGEKIEVEGGNGMLLASASWFKPTGWAVFQVYVQPSRCTYTVCLKMWGVCTPQET